MKKIYIIIAYSLVIINSLSNYAHAMNQMNESSQYRFNTDSHPIIQKHCKYIQEATHSLKHFHDIIHTTVETPDDVQAAQLLYKKWDQDIKNFYKDVILTSGVNAKIIYHKCCLNELQHLHSHHLQCIQLLHATKILLEEKKLLVL